MVWYSHLLKNFPRFDVIYTVKGFGLVYETVREIEMKKFLFSLQKQESRLLTFLLTCLLRNLYAGQEATVRTGHRTTDWFQIGK